MSSAAQASIDDTSEVVAEDHWAKKGDVDLYMHRKYKADGPTPRPVLVLVHGSSQEARTSVDLDVPGHGEYSVMKTFARVGYDVWTMDHEDHGKSSRTDGYSYILAGVEDLKAAMRSRPSISMPLIRAVAIQRPSAPTVRRAQARRTRPVTSRD